MAEQNGVRWRDIERLDRRIDAQDTATKFVAEKGRENNQQIKVHDERFADHDRRLSGVEEAVKDVPVLHERVDTVIEGVRAARNALYAAAGAFLVLAATVIWQASQ